MGRLIYSAISSLDGYIADEHGKFEWGEPDREVHQFLNDLGSSSPTSGASATGWCTSATEPSTSAAIS